MVYTCTSCLTFDWRKTMTVLYSRPDKSCSLSFDGISCLSKLWFILSSMYIIKSRYLLIKYNFEIETFVRSLGMSFKCGIFLLVLVCSIGYCKYLSVHIPKHTNTHTQIKIVLNLSLFLKCGVHNKNLSNSMTLMHSGSVTTVADRVFSLTYGWPNFFSQKYMVKE